MNRASRAALISLLLMMLACGTFEAGLDGTPTEAQDPAASAIAVLENQHARLSTQVTVLQTPSIVTPVPAQPTPQDTLGGGTITSGPFVFDMRLIRDSSFGRHPVTASLYSDLETIGAWTYWYYQGSRQVGPVQTWYGVIPQVDALLQEAYPSIQFGSDGGRAGGVLLPAASLPGDRVQLVLKVTVAGDEFGAVLSFSLQQGPSGLEPTDISVDVLLPAGTATPSAGLPRGAAA